MHGIWSATGASDTGLIIIPEAEPVAAPVQAEPAILGSSISVSTEVELGAAVVVVGVLISIGNERQRKAIEQLRDDVRNWALGIWKSSAKRHHAILKSPPRKTKTGPLPSEFRMATRGRTKMETYELSALNAGIFFDLEADRVWQVVANRPLNSNRLWLYQFPAN